MASRLQIRSVVSIIPLILVSCHDLSDNDRFLPRSDFDLKFTELAKSWDEAIPLGNGMLGALVWEKDNRLRISLDRADLWDLRPMENLEKPEWKYSWVREQWEKDNYSAVQEMFDVPYDRNPAPSKIPGAALEFDISSLGEVESAELILKDAVCNVKWKNGAELELFINHESPVGWFRFSGLDSVILPDLIPPPYSATEDSGSDNPVTGQDLRRLGYSSGILERTGNSITFDQEGWGDFKYQVSVRWENSGSSVEGCWSISSDYVSGPDQITAVQITGDALKAGYSSHFKENIRWWKEYWGKSAISVPDTVLNKQWYLEMYKFGAATGNGAPPISLQAVWTADDGKLPPWKGDFHHDLNTQLSYWPAYSSNHLEQENGFIEWLQKNRPEFENYTKQYYQVPGLNVPGVTTISGQPMGGWIQYSFGPTVSAWLGHHFYLHWRYSMDREFLETKAYPWIRDVAIFLEAISVKDSSGRRRFPLSSSPEIFDNSRNAWFSEMTNFDLGLVRWIFEKATELAGELGLKAEAEKWRNLLSEWPDFDIDQISGFTYAPGFPYNQSHRHFSHLIAFHPLALIDWSHGEKEQAIIKSTIANLDNIGPDWWCGYSYSWLGNIKARAFDGDGAADALRIFARDFCLKNSFHVNGDQSGTGKSKFTYRPFTLEGNLAFASGLQEMLIQSHTGVIRIFPAIPAEWKDLRFDRLRTEGAFLVSASMKEGIINEIIIYPEKGGRLTLLNPFGHYDFRCSENYTMTDNHIHIETDQGKKITFMNRMVNRPATGIQQLIDK